MRLTSRLGNWLRSQGRRAGFAGVTVQRVDRSAVIEHEEDEDPRDAAWFVSAPGYNEVARFTGVDAEQRAIEYAFARYNRVRSWYRDLLLGGSR